jgi:hypothetical protein
MATELFEERRRTTISLRGPPALGVGAENWDAP